MQRGIIYLCIYLCICLSIYPSVYLSIDLPIYRSYLSFLFLFFKYVFLFCSFVLSSFFISQFIFLCTALFFYTLILSILLLFFQLNLSGFACLSFCPPLYFVFLFKDMFVCYFVLFFQFFLYFFLVLPFFLSFLLPSFLPLILGDDSNRSQSINQSIRLSTVFLPFSLWFCPCLYIINFFPTYLSTYFRNCPLWTNFEQVTWATRFWSQKRVSSSLFTNSKNWFKKETNTQNQEENC